MPSVFKRKGASKYTIRWTDHLGQRREKVAYTDKAGSVRLANRLEDEALKRKDGLIDAKAESLQDNGRRSPDFHLEDFESKLIAAGRSDRHINQTCGIVRRFAEATKIEAITEISADKVNAYAKQLKDEGASARTVQAHLTAIISFTRWLAATDKLSRDPLDGKVRKPNPKADRRRERRMLLPAEWQWLHHYLVTKGITRYGMTAHERLLLYATAIQTGLRSGELRQLTPGKIHTDTDIPYIVAKAAGTKNREDARQYIKPDLAASLRELIANKRGGTAVFPMPKEDKVAAMLREDLADTRTMWVKAAGGDTAEARRRVESDFLDDVNHEGERLDFHSLRHTCGAWLARAGAHPKAVQTVMRHSSITLTMDTYGHLFPGQEAETVARFPDMIEAGGERADGEESAHGLHQILHLPETPTGHGMSSHANEEGNVVHREGSPKSSGDSGLCHPLSPEVSNGRRRIRTSEGVRQQIYSLPPLATWVSALGEPRIVVDWLGASNRPAGLAGPPYTARHDTPSRVYHGRIARPGPCSDGHRRRAWRGPGRVPHRHVRRPS